MQNNEVIKQLLQQHLTASSAQNKAKLLYTINHKTIVLTDHSCSPLYFSYYSATKLYH